MNNKAIIEFGFRRIWRILQISEGVIHLGLRPLWITPSLICRMLHILLGLIQQLLILSLLQLSLYHDHFHPKRFKVLVYPRTIILRCRFTVGRLTQTLLKYTFSESLIILNNDGLFTNVKNLSGLKCYSRREISFARSGFRRSRNKVGED